MAAQRIWQEHPFEPVADEQSRLLILGTFPSVRSRAEGFYYGHPRNRFWQVMEAVLEDTVPADIPGRAAWLKGHRVALWDVLASCEITGSSDASIHREAPNDIAGLLHGTGIRTVFANGAAAWSLYQRHFANVGLPEAVKLPSTSPANAAWSLERLVAAWRPALRQALHAHQVQGGTLP